MRACVSLLVIVLMSLPYKGNGQNYSTFDSYFLNPFLYNPAEAATDFTQVQLNHRQQWYGFEGAPKTLTATFTTLLNERRAGIGVKASSFARGILKTTDFSLTYVYGVPVNPKNTLYFGLSGGAITNNIDASEVDSSDPALAVYAEDNIQPAANFGMLLRSESGLNLGVSLPQMMMPKFNSASDFQNTAFSPLDNVIISGYYKRKIDGKIVSKKKRGVRTKVKTKESIAPLELYALYKYSKTGASQTEATLKFNLSERFWVAGLYRVSYGFGGSVGFSFSNVKLNYAYEPGISQAGFTAASHEINLGMQIGDQKKFRRKAPLLKSTLRTNGNEQHIARFQQSTEDPDHMTSEKQEKKKYYVVIKAFNDFTSADAFKQKLVNDKYNANIFYYEKDKKYYVHVLESSKSGDAHDEARNLKLYTKLKDAKVLTITLPKD